MREKERMTGGKISTRDSEKRQNVKKMGEQKRAQKGGSNDKEKNITFQRKEEKDREMSFEAWWQEVK